MYSLISFFILAALFRAISWKYHNLSQKSDTVTRQKNENNVKGWARCCHQALGHMCSQLDGAGRPASDDHRDTVVTIWQLRLAPINCCQRAGNRWPAARGRLWAAQTSVDTCSTIESQEDGKKRCTIGAYYENYCWRDVVCRGKLDVIHRTDSNLFQIKLIGFVQTVGKM